MSTMEVGGRGPGVETDGPTATDTNENSDCSTSLIEAVPFSIRLPTSTLQGFDEPTPVHDDNAVVAMMGEVGIVGSVVVMGRKSAMVWVGWGQLELVGSSSAAPSSSSTSFGSGAPTMGQLVVSMPRTTYRGAFGSGGSSGSSATIGEPSSSQLIGCPSSEDQMLADQMASRLSTRSGRAIFVSCQLSQTPSSAAAVMSSSGGGGGPWGGGGGWTAGLDSEMIAQRAAALSEKKIWQILQEHSE